MNTKNIEETHEKKDWYDQVRELQTISLFDPKENLFEIAQACNWAAALKLKVEHATEAAEEKRLTDLGSTDPDAPLAIEFLERAQAYSLRLVSMLEGLCGDDWPQVANLDETAKTKLQASLPSEVIAVLLSLIKTGNKNVYRFWTCLECLCPEIRRARLGKGDNKYSYSLEEVQASLGLLMFTEEDEPLE